MPLPRHVQASEYSCQERLGTDRREGILPATTDFTSVWVTDAIWIQLHWPRNREPLATSNVPASVRAVAVEKAILPVQVRNTR